MQQLQKLLIRGTIRNFALAPYVNQLLHLAQDGFLTLPAISATTHCKLSNYTWQTQEANTFVCIKLTVGHSKYSGRMCFSICSIGHSTSMRTQQNLVLMHLVSMTCHGVHGNWLYLRLSSILNILSVASPSGKQEGLADSLRVTGLPARTALQE